MQRYFVSFKNVDDIILSEDDIFHITHVMRMNNGDNFEINNDGDIYVALITNVNPFEFKIIKNIEEDHEISKDITLLYCIPKGDKIDLVLQKATELGVKNIVLINSSRTVAKINSSNKEKKLIRFNKIIKEAVEQCKRTYKPEILDIIDYKDIKKYLCDLNFIAYENCNDKVSDLKTLLNNFNKKSISILIGAEGGFSKEEIDYALNLGFSEISLGKRILRSETSVFYLMSVLSFYFED